MIAVNASRTYVNKRVETQFISEVMADTARVIREMQQETADAWNLFKTGELKKSLQGHFSVNNQDGGARLSMRYLTYARFLDMKDPGRSITKSREGYHLYNRIVFGVLYNQTLPKLRYGFTEEVKQAIYSRLLEAVGGDETRATIIMKQHHG
jgi:hypothetical protein